MVASLDRRLLEDGLAIIVSSRERTGDLWHAHYGADAIAAYFWLRENVFTPALAAGSATAEAKAMFAASMESALVRPLRLVR